MSTSELGVGLERNATELAAVASLLAKEATDLAISHSGERHETSVARRAARHADEASEQLRLLTARGDSDPQHALQTAAWALNAAAVALTQAKLVAPAARPSPHRQRCLACGKVSHAATQRGAVVFRHRHRKLCRDADFASLS